MHFNTKLTWKHSEHIFDGTEVCIKHNGRFKEHTDKVFVWCYEANIEADIVGYEYINIEEGGTSLWHIKNEKHRTYFALMWL